MDYMPLITLVFCKNKLIAELHLISLLTPPIGAHVEVFGDSYIVEKVTIKISHVDAHAEIEVTKC